MAAFGVAGAGVLGPGVLGSAGDGLAIFKVGIVGPFFLRFLGTGEAGTWIGVGGFDLKVTNFKMNIA